MSKFNSQPYMQIMLEKPNNDNRFAILLSKIELELLEADNGREILHKMLEEAIDKFNKEL